MTITPWSEDGKRIFSYMIPKSALMKVRAGLCRHVHSQPYALPTPISPLPPHPLPPNNLPSQQNFATERQEYALKEPGGYVVNVVTETLDVPYGKDLITLIQYQMSYAGHKQTRLKVRMWSCGTSTA